MAHDPPNLASRLEFLFDRIDYERSVMPYGSQAIKLDRMRDLLRQLDNPHLGLPCIHIAGTKGKGSTASMMASVAAASGYRCGLFTSPHLHSIEERIAVDGRPISQGEFVELLEGVRPAVLRTDRDWVRADCCGPTYFEIITAMAFACFRQQRVDMAVMEVGLGGRLDSTNVCQPLLSIITSISLDHVRQLGTTPSAIAGEKAGIIKPGVPVISGVVQSEPADVIENAARARGARLYRLQRDFDVSLAGVEPDDSATNASMFDYLESSGGAALLIPALRIPLRGSHQTANASLVCSSVMRLRELGWTFPETALRAGLGNCRCPARAQVIRDSPLVVLDVAHNRASVEALLESIPRRRFGRRVLIFAASQDKDLHGMLEVLLPNFDRILLTRFKENPRAVSPDALARICAQFPSNATKVSSIECVENAREAWTRARSEVAPEDLLCISGSFFLAAELSNDVESVKGGCW